MVVWLVEMDACKESTNAHVRPGKVSSSPLFPSTSSGAGIEASPFRATFGLYPFTKLVPQYDSAHC
jgi:hypothetical protein